MSNDRFMTKDSVSRVAIKLAWNTAVLGASTITGNGKTRPPDPNEIKAALRKRFQETSPTEFEMIWSCLLIPRSTVKI